MSEAADEFVLTNAEVMRGRFASKVRVMSNGCHLWVGANNGKKSPYGRMNIGGNQAKFVRTHRVAWLLAFGEIPRGLHVLHRCDNTLCVNPDHLFLGSHLENMSDRERKGRNNPIKGDAWHGSHDGKHPSGDNHYLRRNPERAPHGERSPLAKLAERDVLAIRAAWAASPQKRGLRREIAEKFGVHVDTVSLIVRRRTWRYV